MMPILRWPHVALRTKCDPVDLNDPELPGLIDEMHAIVKASKGMALAANQLGVLKRLFVGYNRDATFINPRITGYPAMGKTSYPEGCLSLPGYQEMVPRFISVIVEYYDWTKKVVIVEERCGWAAVEFQHELDHLDGIFFAERARGGKDRARAWLRSHR